MLRVCSLSKSVEPPHMASYDYSGYFQCTETNRYHLSYNCYRDSVIPSAVNQSSQREKSEVQMVPHDCAQKKKARRFPIKVADWGKTDVQHLFD